ncbi:MAG: DUF3536 domain-containing protein [Longimicrobiales bacterium]
MKRYVCVHGHFYQPPRENPWLESIELQDSAYPYHDWNARISSECYAPNTASRILDTQGRIKRIVNNYAHISFNFGPTLLAWLEEQLPETYAHILEADRESAARFSGHGSALAQCYNHLIMPLASARDKRTQVLWGLRDFAHRFGREAEGMWLPETAVDLETLDILAEHGVRFTILAPHQASAVRRIGSSEWRDVSGGRIDGSRPYLQRLPSGRDIAIFFYDGPVSRAVAFENLLRNGERFAQRLVAVFGDADPPRLAHIATDGETYGHHHRHGDMALAYALDYIDNETAISLTNYGEYLERHPPEDEVRIIENTSWSCAHGIERWRADCGCRTGGRPGWNQAWRAPLREALDWLNAAVGPQYETAAAELMRDPCAARDDYIDIVVDRSAESVDAFLGKHARGPLNDDQRVRAIRLLELERHAMLMFTSCGWFFNELSGIETVQVLQYAGRAIQLAQSAANDPRASGLETEFLSRISRAHSNIPEVGDGRTIYETYVRPARVDLPDVAAHYAVSSLLSGNDEGKIYCYHVEPAQQQRRQLGESQLFVGRAKVSSAITLEHEDVAFAVVHFGSQNLSGGLRRIRGDENDHALADQLVGAFEKADTTRVVQLLAQFPESTFSLKSLFSDRRREVLDYLMHDSLVDAEAAYREVYERDASLMRFLIDLDARVPRAFLLAAQYIVDAELRRAFARDHLDLARARLLMTEAETLKIRLDHAGLAYVVKQTLEQLAVEFERDPQDFAALERLADLAAAANALPFEIDRWKVQNLYYGVAQGLYPARLDRARAGDPDASRWVDLFTAVGKQIRVAVA